MDNKTGSNHGFKVVRKCKKITGNIGNIIKPRTPFLARFGHPRTEKKVRKRSFPPNALFFTFPLGFADDFRRRSYPKRQKKALFGQRSYSKGPNHALEKVPKPTKHPVFVCVSTTGRPVSIGSNNGLPRSYHDLGLELVGSIGNS